MRILTAIVSNVVGLFVSDWTQTLGIVLILVVGFAASRLVHGAVAGYTLAGLLGLHLMFTTAVETRKRLASMRRGVEESGLGASRADGEGILPLELKGTDGS